MSFRRLIKKKQNRLLSKTWRTKLSNREVERNNYHATGDLRKAREFAATAERFKRAPIKQEEICTEEPIVIFSRQLHL